MLEELKFTEARGDFSTLYSRVFNHYRPVIIRRRQAEEVLVLRADLQKLLLEKYRLKPEVIREGDGSVTLALDELELYANGRTVEEAAQELVQDLKFYAQDYLERSQLFINAPNRRGHFPYILRVLLCGSDEEIRSLLEI
ncbi:MAG: exoribonuclease R [Armatimonadetes bacterium]|nr:exoribonuclease R [Armatimonadota bacterium]